MRLNKLGRYDLIRVLGKGAMGLVYEGRDPNLDRRVAIKTILVENLSDEAAAEYEVRFRTEARSAARLQHPNIVSVYDSDRDLDMAYLVMEFIQGDDLKHHLDKGDVYTLEQTLAIMQGLLSALDYAHQQGIVLRDIKPANLLIEASGRVKLTDFGVARIQNSGEATRTQGTMVGTLKYMSPEQIQGRPVDARADLFAAGIVLYQLLTGQRPFDADSDFAVIQQIVSHDPTPPSHFNPKLPSALDAVLARALAKSRDQRYGSAQVFSEALQAASQQAADPTVAPPSRPRDKRAIATWTATLQAGESLLSTQPLTSTGTQANINTNSSGSIVTQELELVYWKDIKDSVEVEEFEVFLAKFPGGVYADLARRRLRKLAHPFGESSNIGLAAHLPAMVAAIVAAPAPADDDATVRVPRPSANTVTPADAAAVNASPVVESVLVDSTPGATVSALADNLETAPKAFEQAAPAPAAPAAPTAFEQAISLAGDMPASVAPVAVIVTTPADTSAQLAKTPAAPAIATVMATTATPAAQSVHQAPPQPPAQAETYLPSDPIAAANPPQRLVWAVAGVVALACAGLGVRFLSGRPAADASLAIATPASETAVAVLAPARTPPVLPAAVSPAVDVVAMNSVPALAVTASAPAASASTAAAAAVIARAALAQATAKKATIEKDKLAKQSVDKNGAQPSPDASAPATPSRPAANSAVAATPAQAQSQATITNNPRQACEDRVLIGFQICMREQCAKPAFVNHPVCMERKAMEQQRRDTQMGK